MAKAKKKSAKKAAAKPSAKPTTAAKAKDIMRMPGPAMCKSLEGELTKILDEADGVALDQSETLAGYKKKGIHPGMFKRVMAMKRSILKSDRGAKSEATKILHFEHYCEVLGVNKLLEQQGELLKRDVAKDTEAGTEQVAETAAGTKPKKDKSGDKSIDGPDPESHATGTPPGEADMRPTFLKEGTQAIDESTETAGKA